MLARPIVASIVLALMSLAVAARGDDRQNADAAWKAKNWKDAAAAYEKVVAANEKDGDAWYRLGFALHSTGDIEKALAAHRKAMEIDGPQRPIAAYNAACALALLKRNDEAFTTLEKAIGLGFANARQIEADTDLAGLRADARWASIRDKLSKPADSRDDVRRQFDFWVGDWEVRDASGTKLGENRIEKLQDGFVIQENWTDGTGATGMSINYVDPRDGKWKQVWMDARGWSTHKSGEFKDGAMRLIGESCLRDGRKNPIRATWTPLPDGRVRQYIESSSDNGQTWKAGFDGYYSRKKATDK